MNKPPPLLKSLKNNDKRRNVKRYNEFVEYYSSIVNLRTFVLFYLLLFATNKNFIKFQNFYLLNKRISTP